MEEFSPGSFHDNLMEELFLGLFSSSKSFPFQRIEKTETEKRTNSSISIWQFCFPVKNGFDCLEKRYQAMYTYLTGRYETEKMMER